MADWQPDIFSFLDYREYLRAYYEAAKANTRAFSYRYFSRRAGYSSPNILKLVIEGERGLTPESQQRFADALGLEEDERRFFKHLVAFNQAETAEDKSAAFEKVSASQRFQQARRIERGMYAYLSRWYFPAIREMSARGDFVEDPAWIADQLLPRIEPEQVVEALEILLDLGLVVRDGTGRLRRGDPTLTTGHEVRHLAVGNYHRQMLARAAESIALVPSRLRDLSAVTVCVSRETVEELKQRIHLFREQLIGLCDRDHAPQLVYQINLQCFPLNQVEEEDA